MASILLTLLLALQLLCTPFPYPQNEALIPYDSCELPPKAHKLWWGMLDPELSAWFASIPSEDADLPLQWNWSWRGFLAALFEQPLLKEGAPDANIL